MLERYGNLVCNVSELEHSLLRYEPELSAPVVEVHSPTVVTTMLMLDCGAWTKVRWSYGASGRWSAIPLYGL